MKTQIERHILIVLNEIEHKYYTLKEIKSLMLHNRNWRHNGAKIHTALSKLKREGKLKYKLVRGTDRRQRHQEYYKLTKVKGGGG